MLLNTASLFAEQFRIAKTHLVEVEQSPDFLVEKKLGLNDVIAIFLPEDKEFIDGIEVKMDIPELVAYWRDCCGFYIYQDIKPKPSSDQIDYSGNKIFFDVVPGRLSWIIEIPLNKDSKLKSNQYTTILERIPDISNGYLFLRLQQVMKGTPEEVLASQIKFTIRPILSNKGRLNVNILLPEKIESINPNENSENEIPSESLQNINSIVYIDENPYEYKNICETGLLLDVGIHNISVITPEYRTEVRTIRIEQAQRIPLDIQLKSIEPTVILSAPEGTSVFVDNIPVNEFDKEMKISEGEHKFKVVIGDYEIIRNITIVKGKTYKINLAVDLEIEEE